MKLVLDGAKMKEIIPKSIDDKIRILFDKFPLEFSQEVKTELFTLIETLKDKYPVNYRAYSNVYKAVTKELDPELYMTDRKELHN